MRLLSIVAAALLVLGFMVGPGLAGEATLLSDEQLAEITGAQLLEANVDVATQDVSGMASASSMNLMVSQYSQVAGQNNVVGITGATSGFSVTQINSLGF